MPNVVSLPERVKVAPKVLVLEGVKVVPVVAISPRAARAGDVAVVGVSHEPQPTVADDRVGTRKAETATAVSASTPGGGTVCWPPRLAELGEPG
jgi:hypothetical protein